jgi:hypothetical protein
VNPLGNLDAAKAVKKAAFNNGTVMPRQLLQGLVQADHFFLT